MGLTVPLLWLLGPLLAGLEFGTPMHVQEAQPAPAADPWTLQATLPDGAERTEAILRSLADASFTQLHPSAQRDRLDVAFHAFLDAGERFAGDEMLSLAQGLYDRAPAIWSAFCLEGALRRGHGRYAEADAVIAERLAIDGEQIGEMGRVELLERRAIIAAGRGAWAQERALLGPALVHGGRDARQILGLRALSRGDRPEAARLFGALLTDSAGDQPVAPKDRPAWALRGWGLALLP